MTKEEMDEFFGTKWNTVELGRGKQDTYIKLENEKGEIKWVNVQGLLTVAAKMHLQYWDEDVKMIWR